MFVILWIEDNTVTVADQISEAEKQGFKVMVKDMPHAIKQVLETQSVQGIVIDVMLYGASNLDAIGIPHCPTNGGKDAGWFLLEKLIWTSNSHWRAIPTLILSARPYDAYQKAQFERVCKTCEIDQQTVVYVEKGEVGWQKKFSDWLKKLASPSSPTLNKEK